MIEFGIGIGFPRIGCSLMAFCSVFLRSLAYKLAFSWLFKLAYLTLFHAVCGVRYLPWLCAGQKM